MKQLKFLIVVLLVVHSVLAILKGFDVWSSIDLALTLLLVFLVVKSDKEE
ncbi:TPA: hypothetical protein TZE22_000791 [Streptococcus suis]|nr:hypothetical protein [Streptococcus suis]HEM5166999.1 hypothetical protein [Streptococcus suis]HEM5178161.1 hypothetical protein [Streptococcus suis]